MHLSEGVLQWPVLLSTATVAGAGVIWGLRSLPVERLPQAAVLTAIFFVGGTIHVPIGIASVHLVLSGLLGLLLGWAVFPVLLVGLLLQAVLLSFGGFTVLGANLLILGLPAALVGSVLRPRLARLLGDCRQDAGAKLGGVLRLSLAMWLAGLAAALSLLGSMMLAAFFLWWSGGERFWPLISLLSVAHVPALLVDALITALAISALIRMAPDVCQSLLQAPKARARRSSAGASAGA
jgi:cobalt/nickel transport system permease protein